MSQKNETLGYDEVEKRLFCKLINTVRNADILESVPHMDFLDLSAVFYYYEDSCGHGEKRERLVTCEDAKRWDKSLCELMDRAVENTLLVLGEEMWLMNDLINKLLEGTNIKNRPESGVDMYVLTNNARCNGAISMLIGSEMANLAAKLGRDLVIIPSSIHEVILLAVGEDFVIERINSIIKEINKTELRPDEILSDHAYYYDRKSGKIT